MLLSYEHKNNVNYCTDKYNINLHLVAHDIYIVLRIRLFQINTRKQQITLHSYSRPEMKIILIRMTKSAATVTLFDLSGASISVAGRKVCVNCFYTLCPHTL